MVKGKAKAGQGRVKEACPDGKRKDDETVENGKLG